MATRLQVTFDCADPAALSAFWVELLGYELDPPPEGYDSWEAWLAEMGVPEESWNDASAASDPDRVGPRLFFQRVPEPKTAKNRVHLDVEVGGGRDVAFEERRGRVRSASERAVALGADQVREVEQRGEYWIVMHDPEGNEFCLH